MYIVEHSLHGISKGAYLAVKPISITCNFERVILSGRLSEYIVVMSK